MLIAKANIDNSIEIFRRASLKSEPVIFSTDTIYGIGAPLSDMAANEKIFEIKGRDKSKPFPVLIATSEQLSEVAIVETKTQRQIIDKVWPGPVTLILKVKEGINDLFTVNGTIAVRMPEKKWLRELLKHTGAMSATSANPAEVDYVNDEQHICKTFNNRVKFFLFDNNVETLSSSIIDLSNDQPTIIRAGENLSIIKKIIS
ncbi:MAG: threonylcarbamoyl-AMP synthase [Denitrovibrio sp.]|nr:MAG: threonylcarbamoyl-AMP synthase [Denitrovibrio sp.]